MADTGPYSATPWYSQGMSPQLQALFNPSNLDYLGRRGYKAEQNYPALGGSGANVTGSFGIPAQKVGLTNLLQMLLTQGRVDPRLLAQAQAQNSQQTQQQQDAVRAQAARSGMSGGGLQAALQAAIGSAGANRSANLNYQDLSDSYRRNQENLGLLNQLVIQPELGFGSLGEQSRATKQDAKNKELAAGVSLIGGGLNGLFGGMR